MMTSIVMFYLTLVILSPGCPQYIPKPDLNLKRYKGTWYEIYRPYEARFESGDCITVSYEDDDFEPNVYFKVTNA
jgi:lipocalin